MLQFSTATLHKSTRIVYSYTMSQKPSIIVVIMYSLHVFNAQSVKLCRVAPGIVEDYYILLMSIEYVYLFK